MKALIERYRLTPRKMSLCDDFDWDAYDDSELVRFCFDGGGGKQETSNEPWGPQQEPLKYLFDESRKLYDKGPREYFGGGVTPLAGETEEALRQTTRRAREGSGLLKASQDYTGNVLEGEYENPFAGDVVADMGREAYGDTMRNFGIRGRSGASGLAASAFADRFADRALPFAAQQEDLRRGRMEAAANRAPGLAREDYGDPRELARVGAVRQEQADRELDDRRREHDFGQNERSRLVQEYGANIDRRNYGGSQTSSGTPGLFDWASLGAKAGGK